MENEGKKRILRRRECLQTVAAGGAVMPAMGLGAAGFGINPDMKASYPDNEASSEGTVSIENQTLRVSFDSGSGALVGLESKLTRWRIQDRRELGRSFVMMVPLPGRRDNPVLGEKNQVASLEKSADGKSITFVWNNLESEFGGRLDITLKTIVTLDEHGLSF